MSTGSPVVETPADVQTWITAKTGVSEETWFTLGKFAMSMILATGAIKPADATTLYGAITNMAVAVVALVAGSWTVVNYIKAHVPSRTAIKLASMGARAGGTDTTTTTETKPT
jgi:hypothetical protein